MYDVTRPIDGEFTFDELCLALKQSKNTSLFLAAFFAEKNHEK